jgi:hypothetical protein
MADPLAALLRSFEPTESLAAPVAQKSIGNPILNALAKILPSASNVLGGAALMAKSSDLNSNEQSLMLMQELRAKAGDKIKTSELEPLAMHQPQKNPLPLDSSPPLSVRESSSSASPPGKILGQLRKNAKLVATFGVAEEWIDPQGNRFIVEKARPINRPVDVDATYRQAVQGSQFPSIDKELEIWKSLDGTAKIDKSLAIIQMSEEGMAKRLGQLTEIANQRSGLLDAEQNLQLNKAEDVTSGYAQRRPGALSAETQDAHNLVNQATIQSQRVLQSLLLSDPEYQKMESISKSMARHTNMFNTIRAEQDKDEAKYGWIDNQIISNYKTVFDGNIEDVKAAKVHIANKAAKDKTFEKIISINKSSWFNAMLDPDIGVRQAAMKIATKAEEVNGGDPNLIKILTPLVADRTKLLDPKDERTKEFSKKLQAASGIKEKELITREALETQFAEGLTNYMKDYYSDMSKWPVPNDPSLLKIISDQKLASGKKNLANYKNVLETYFPSNLDQNEFNRRKQVVAQSFSSFMQADKPSWVIPDKSGFQQVMSSMLEQEMTRRTLTQKLVQLGGTIGPLAGSLWQLNIASGGNVRGY